MGHLPFSSQLPLLRMRTHARSYRLTLLSSFFLPDQLVGLSVLGLESCKAKARGREQLSA